MRAARLQDALERLTAAIREVESEPLREGHCAVDPEKIPYGGKVVFPDAECVAVDTGPDVVNRRAARACGRSAAERSAIVIDRFFDTKQKALAWAKANPHFIVVQVHTPDTEAAY